MGIRIDPEGDPTGDNCLTCWPGGTTPRILYATFNGIEKGGNWMEGYKEPPNWSFQLIQDDVQPCKYTYYGDLWTCQYYSSFDPTPGAQSSLRLYIGFFPAVQAFWKGIMVNCVSRFESEFSEPPNREFKNGTGWIFSLTV